jgi:Tfp pilus assembly protein PilV
MTREDYEAQKAATRAKNLQLATDDAASLQERITNMLRSRLPSVYDVRPITDTMENGDVRRRVEVTEVASQLKWSIRLRVQLKGSYAWATAYEVQCLGDRYSRERRMYQPEYKLTKSGWNYERMADDAERAIKAAITQREVAQRRASNTERSEATFKEVLACVGGKTAYPGAHYATVTTPKFTIELSAGDFWDGTVRVKVSLDKNGLTAAQAIEIIEQLRRVQ